MVQLAPYPEVQKLVAEGDVSYDDALVMVGLRRPQIGDGPFGDYGPEPDEKVFVETETTERTKPPRKKKNPFIRSERAKKSKKHRKHAGTAGDY